MCHSKVLQLHAGGRVLRLFGAEHDCLHGLRGLQGSGSQLCYLPELGRCCFCIMELLQDRDHMALSGKDVVLALRARSNPCRLCLINSSMQYGITVITGSILWMQDQPAV